MITTKVYCKFRKPSNQCMERKNKLARRACFKIVFCKCVYSGNIRKYKCKYIYTCKYRKVEKNSESEKKTFISINSDSSLVDQNLSQLEGRLLFLSYLFLIISSLSFKFRNIGLLNVFKKNYLPKLVFSQLHF